ncbi:unnamed protein product [Closterium sp. NIES-53]
MATPSVLTFDAEGRAVDFEVWVDDLQLFLQCDRADGLSLFDLTSGASPAPPATADSTVRSQWATRDAAARLAVRRHLPTTERAHFSQYRSAQTLYDAEVARYSSPATAALSRLILPYLFPDLSAFPTVADLITYLRTSDTRYRAALPAEDHFLSVCPTTLTVDLLEQRLLAAETSIVAVGASRGDPRTPVFEGCSPSPLLPSVASAATADLGGFELVEAASAPSGKRRPGRGKGGKGNGGTGGGGGGGGGGSGGGWGGGGRGGGGGGVGSSSGGGGGGGGGGGSGGGGGGGVGGHGGGGGGSGGSGGAGRGSTQRSGSGGGQRQQQQRSRETPSPQQLREWYAGRQQGGGTGPCTYVLRTGDRAGEQCGGLHSTQRCFGRLTDAWHHQLACRACLRSALSSRWQCMMCQCQGFRTGGCSGGGALLMLCCAMVVVVVVGLPSVGRKWCSLSCLNLFVSVEGDGAGKEGEQGALNSEVGRGKARRGEERGGEARGGEVSSRSSGNGERWLVETSEG